MERYSQQIGFIGEENQRKLSERSAAIVGIGALGTVAAQHLARAGVGRLILIDHDIIEKSNLQRQNLFDENDVGKLKARIAKHNIEMINGDIDVVAEAAHLDEDNLELLDSDVVLDCTDNLETRFLINEYCKKNEIDWVHAAAAGSIGVILPITGKYCFNCIFGHAKDALSCDDAGILNTASSVTASLQSTIALKLLIDEKIEPRLTRIDVWNDSFESIRVKRDSDCPVCNDVKKAEEKKENNSLFDFGKCKTRAAYSAKPNKNLELDLERLKDEFDVVIDTPIVLVINESGMEVIIHEYGELVFKNSEDEERMKELADKIYGVGLRR